MWNQYNWINFWARREFNDPTVPYPMRKLTRKDVERLLKCTEVFKDTAERCPRWPNSTLSSLFLRAYCLLLRRHCGTPYYHTDLGQNLWHSPHLWFTSSQEVNGTNTTCLININEIMTIKSVPMCSSNIGLSSGCWGRLCFPAPLHLTGFGQWHVDRSGVSAPRGFPHTTLFLFFFHNDIVHIEDDITKQMNKQNKTDSSK